MQSETQAETQAGELDGRVEPRTNLFMAATLLSGGREIVVKIRDLSTSGAQIEGCDFPEVGSVMILVRGGLRVRGHVTWSTERRCGLHFSTHISVPNWMASPVNREQQRVDHAVAAVKAGAVPTATASDPRALAVDELVEDLKRVAKLLEMLGDAFAGDLEIVTRHGVMLQNLDIALQTITALAASVCTADFRCDSGDSVSRVRLEDLRVSCDQALGAKG
ncbi:MAG TPA: PilZ domain-containing protein [Sphingomicrobium sp.]|nr:PilZ domain-containing protein [Sphingomicrobium sp.]